MADDEYNPFPNQAPARPPDPPAYEPVTPLDHAVEAFIASVTPGHQQVPALSHPTIEFRKADLRDRLKQFAESILADSAIAHAAPEGEPHAEEAC